MLQSTLQLYRKAYSGLTRHVWLLSMVMLINRSGTMVLAFLTLYSKSLGYTIEQGGWVVAIYGLGSFVGGFLGGKLSDTFGFYKIQFAALFFGGILFIVLGQMDSYLSICLCSFVLSMVNEMFRPANASAIAHYSTPANRTQSFSLVRLAINLGWGVGIALGGFLASINYHLLFWVDGFTNITAALILLAVLPRVNYHKLAAATFADAPPLEGSAASPLKDKDFLLFLGFLILFACCFFQLFTTVPVYFKENLGLNEFWIGVVMAVNGILIALFEMVIVFKIEGRKPYLYLIALGTVLMGASFLLLNLPLSSGFLVAILAILMLTVAEMVSMPFMNSYYISRSNVATVGRYAGMYTMAWSAAQVIGSSSGSALAQKFGYHTLWVITAVACTAAAAGFYWLLQYRSPIKMPR